MNTKKFKKEPLKETNGLKAEYEISNQQAWEEHMVYEGYQKNKK